MGERLRATDAELRWSVSWTTRPRRPGETDGVDYRFVTREAFERLRDAGGFLEWFEVYGDLNTASRLVDACKIPRIAPSFGGVESLIEQPARMSYYRLSTEERLQVGIRDALVRYAVGIEDAEDLIADLARALEQI